MGSGRRDNAAHPSYESLDAFFCGCLERVEAAYAKLNKACKVKTISSYFLSLRVCVALFWFHNVRCYDNYMYMVNNGVYL